MGSITKVSLFGLSSFNVRLRIKSTFLYSGRSKYL